MEKISLLFSSALLLLIDACAPVALGGTAVVGTEAVRNEKGVSGAVSDTDLQARINNQLFKIDKDLFDRVALAVKHGIVVVAGYMKDNAQRQKSFDIVKAIEGSLQVGNEMDIGDLPSASELASDSGITTRIKGSLLVDGNVHSLNYDVTTVNGIVYICGTAQTEYERDVVMNNAKATSGVKKAVSYIKIKENRPA